MRMEMFELSKRKGSTSALCLVALLSLVLGGCPRPGTRIRLQGPSTCSDYPLKATFEVQYIRNTIFIPQTVCVRGGGTLTFKPSGDNNKNKYDFNLCFASEDSNPGPFTGMSPNLVGVWTQPTSQKLIAVEKGPITYTFTPCLDSGGNLDLEGLTGSLQVGTGGTTDETTEPLPPG
jgi:hypothetical protein